VTTRLLFFFLLLASAARPAGAAEPPQRIVSLAPSITEIVFALGAGDRLVGVSTYCDYPEAAQRIDKVGTFLQPNVERILAARPDLVLAIPSPANRLPVESMVDLGLRVVVVDPNRIDSVYATIRTVAALLGDSTAGEKLVADMRERVARIAERLDGVEKRRVLVLVGRQPLIGAGGGTYQDEIVALAGGTNLAAQVAGEWPTLSLEFVLARAPEVIIDAGMGSEEESEGDRKAFWGQFAALPAVRDNRVFGYRAYELLRPGPRLPETLEAVARFIHPERFASTSD